MTARHAIAIDLGPRCLRALAGVWERDRLRVSHALCARVPDDVDGGDPKALGSWAGRALTEAGLGRGKATVVVPREHVVLKRLSLPTSEPRELPEMTRLALQRDLPFDPAQAVIDFVFIGGGGGSTSVLAAAVPGPSLSAVRQSIRSAGRSAEHLALRTMGVTALLRDERAVLAVDITAEGVEFSVVADGMVRFCRAGELPPLDDPDQVADAVVTEARRTWMSYRIATDSEDVRRAVVIGDRSVAEPAAAAIEQILNVETTRLTEHPLVDAAGARAAGDLGELWPLAGLLAAPSIRLATIDFADPTRAPDTSSRKRQVVLGAAGLAVVLAAAGFTLARRDLADLTQTAERLEAQRDMRRPQYLRYGRDLYKLTHLQQWESVDPQWLGHLDSIVTLAPGPDELVLDAWSGTLTFGGVKFDRKTNQFSAPSRLRITLEGEAADRATADAFRGRLVQTNAYRITTAGPDAASGRRLPFGFQYNLAAEPEAGP